MGFRRLAGWSAAGFLVLTAAGCKTERATESAKSHASSAVKSAPPVDCVPEPSGAVLTISPEDDARLGDAGLDLPYAVEIGMATDHAGGFVVAALREATAATHAVLGLLPFDGHDATVIDLMRVHGAVVPPQVAVVGDQAVVAIADGDANGVLTRLARIGLSGSTHHPTFGAVVPQGQGESPTYGVLADGETGVLYWDEWNERKKHGIVRIVRFETRELKLVGTPLAVSVDGQDADGPSVIPRPGGYWAAWTTHAAEQAGDESSPQWIMVRPLHSDGTPAGQAIEVSPKSGYALSFDLAAAPDGGLLVAWREDRSAFATAGGQVLLARVSAGGSVEREPVPGERIGAAAPALLTSSETQPARWLTTASPADDALAAAVDPNGRLLTGLVPVETLENRVMLARRADRVLVATQRGRRAELGVVRCRVNARPALP